ncbi:MAG TPA: hypothetical protein VLJ19_08960 [Variovorax sp.]|nr:hypothetical protein [Variovorax sp.]
MNANRADYSLVVLGFASLAGGIACLGWASSLGGFRFLGATAAIFLAMLSFIRFAALRRPRMTARSIPMPDPKCESIRAPIMPSQRDMEDAELATKLAALRVRRPQPYESRIAPLEPDPAVVVIEGPPLEPDEPEAAPEMPTVGLRQMDELRAEIARLREGARVRHASIVARTSEPPGAQVAHGDAGENFPRTEFTGLGATPSEGSSFTKTEYLGPIELRQ